MFESQKKPRVETETENQPRDREQNESRESRPRVETERLRGISLDVPPNSQKFIYIPHNIYPQYLSTDIHINLLKFPHIHQYPSQIRRYLLDPSMPRTSPLILI